MYKNNVIEIKEDLEIGDIILEAGDKIKVLENKKSLKEDFIEIMMDPKTRMDMSDLMFAIQRAYNTWEKESKYYDFSDEGLDFPTAVAMAKSEIIDNIKYMLGMKR